MMFPKGRKTTGKIDTSQFAFPKVRKTSKKSTDASAFPKPSRVKSPKTIEKTRKQACEISGHTKGLHQHHVVPKGAGGPDIKENLITLDAENHTKAHNGQISRDALWEIVARREGKTVEEIRRIVAQAMGREFV